MRLALLASSDDNPYACTLLVRLLQAERRPVLVLSTYRRRLVRAWRYARTHGLGALFRQLGGGTVDGTSRRAVREALTAYAAAHGLKGWQDGLAAICRRAGMPCRRVQGVNDARAVSAVRQAEVDLVLSTTGEIYRQAMIAAPRIGLLNAHMAFLPRFRGMNVLEWSILVGEPPGVTIHFVAEKIDTGDIVVSRHLPVLAGDTLEKLRARSIPLNIDLMLEAIEMLERDPSGVRRSGEGEGRQYFVMHPRLRRVVENIIRKNAS